MPGRGGRLPPHHAGCHQQRRPTRCRAVTLTAAAFAIGLSPSRRATLAAVSGPPCRFVRPDCCLLPSSAWASTSAPDSPPPHHAGASWRGLLCFWRHHSHRRCPPPPCCHLPSPPLPQLPRRPGVARRRPRTPPVGVDGDATGAERGPRRPGRRRAAAAATAASVSARMGWRGGGGRRCQACAPVVAGATG